MARLARNNSNPDSHRRVTLLHVAHDAGVSRATVSLVLRGSSLVAEPTRERVLASMQKMGYVYHRAAASLRTQHSQTVGLVVTDITNPFFAEMTVGIEARLDAANHVALLGNSAELLSKQDRLLATMQEYPADGLLLCPAEDTPVQAIERLQRSRLPFVLFARYLPEIETDYVGADNVAGAEMAVEHLITHGHRRIAFIGGPLHSSARHDRAEGYRRALERHGLAGDERLLITTPTTREGGYRGILSLLQGNDPPSAALCYNDVVAIGALLGLQSAGRAPGKDFAVVGFDDIDEAALTRPALTTIAVAPRQIGEEAVSLLFERMGDLDGQPRKVILPARLVVRESCGCQNEYQTQE